MLVFSLVDALLKMALFASGMLTSPNYSGPSRELLVARFYVNEADFATKEIASAIKTRDAKRALQHGASEKIPGTPTSKS